MSRKSKQSSVLSIGLDIGFGETKLVSGDVRIKIPTVFGIAGSIVYGAEELSASYPNQMVEHNGHTYFVGDLAISQFNADNQQRLRGQDDVAMDYRLLMMKTALAHLLHDTVDGDVVHIYIVTGLPVDHMFKSDDVDALKRTLTGQHLIQTNGANFVANVQEVSVMPEPVGTMFAFHTLPSGDVNQHYTASKTAVVNGGELTIDVSVDKDGEFLALQSKSSSNGHHLAMKSITNVYQKEYGQAPDAMTLRSIMHNRSANIRGVTTSFYDDVEKALSFVRNGALSLLQTTIQRGVDVDSVIVSGALALTSFEQIKQVYVQATKSENPVFDTAQGYYNYSQFKMKGM